MGRINFPVNIECFEYWLDKAVARVAGQTFAVRPEVRQLATAVPDRHGGAGGNLCRAWQRRQGFEIAQRAGQVALATGLLYGEELDALRCIFVDQLGKVLLITDVARAGRIPE